MKDAPIKLHPLLLKQLKRSNLALNDLEAHGGYYDFIRRISRAYDEHDKEHYLSVRALEISSREMAEINERLEYAQKVARLGYWSYDRQRKLFTWSNEMYDLTGMEPFKVTPTLQHYKNLIHEQYRADFCNYLDEVFLTKSPQVMELKCYHEKSKQYSWHYIKLYSEIEEEDREGQVFGIVLDITERKQREAHLKDVHQKLLDLSRQAGMSEVASMMLHNIGNIMNSTWVSATLIQESFAKNYPHKLQMITQLIDEHSDQLKSYLTEDSKGKLIPDYLIELAKVVQKDHAKNVSNLTTIQYGLQHINEIITMQNFMGKAVGFNEPVYVPELLEKALQMSLNIKKQSIILQKDYAKPPIISIDKSKLLQIFTNLFQNAYDAVTKEKKNINKKITITVNNDSQFIYVLIKDNGIGIEPDNLHQIFSFGYTTKMDGHGFGLHSSAIAAKEMNGSLRAESAGPGKGASFILTLPVKDKPSHGDDDGQ